MTPDQKPQRNRLTEGLHQRAYVNPMVSVGGEISTPADRLADGELPADVAYQLVHDEAMLDGNARLNLATFVTTFMDDQAGRLYAESYAKNLIDKDEYPATALIEQRCTSMMANLWNAPGETIGVSAVGSSEASMLGGLAMKKRWQAARRAAGKSTETPNLVMSSAVQVVWERFCRYWDVEPRFVPITRENPNMAVDAMLDHVDENTIGVVGILGVTYTGTYEPIADYAAALDDLQARTGLDVPLHVDAASGGMIAPFLQPDLIWDFRLSRVHSINTSGHKYGLVYPGLGWVVWRSKDLLPEDMIFNVSYLGGEMPTLGINFSRPGAQVLLQYYMFIRLGRTGYTRVQQVSQDVAVHLSRAIGAMPEFTLLSDGTQIPVFAWRLADGFDKNWTLSHLSDLLRYHGWQVPSYPMPENVTDLEVMRIVVRNGFSMDLADALLRDISAAVEKLNTLGPMVAKARHSDPYAH